MASVLTKEDRAQMLAKAKAQMADKKPEGNEFKVTVSDQTVTYTQEDMPEKPVLHFQGCKDSTLSISSCSTVVKILIENCTECNIEIPNGAKITTSVVEAWNCTNVKISSEIAIGTLQADISHSLSVSFSEISHLGQLVQAGVQKLDLSFGDRQDLSLTSGVSAIKETICPELSADDKMTQFITRFVDGNLLTEEIIRLANEYPTTAREKAQHDAELQKKEKALHAMAGNLLGSDSKLSDSDQKELKDHLEKVSVEHAAQKQDVPTDDGRAEFKRQLGNEQFKIGEFHQAAVFYTEALNINDKLAPVWANRAMCWLKMANAAKALADADACIALDDKYTKAHFRRGVALVQLDRLVDACKAFRSVLDLDPNNAQAKSSMMLAEKKLAQNGGQ
eukprot:m.194965 g.194965  ORF g.194965 m.194965 type:complete len:392 (-) comp18672_c0_seq2:480-1655(-)